MLTRRIVLAALARPALAQPAASRTLVFVPQAALTSLDPIWTSATVTRNRAFLVFDTLYGLDEALMPQPQMAAGHVMDPDGKRWTIMLRPGQLFHDGSKVLARDCVASLQRWMRWKRQTTAPSSSASIVDFHRCCPHLRKSCPNAWR